MSSLDFSGLSVVVTGAASGIGLAVARAFIEHGACVEMVDRHAAALKEASGQLARVTSHVVDLSQPDQVASFAHRLQERDIRIHALINNAGIEYPTPLDDDTLEAGQRWAALLHNNVTSMYLLTRALLPLFRQNASIINQSSIWGKTGVADFSAYVASKHAVIGLTRSLAWELGKQRIRVNAVCPGWVRTDASMRSLKSIADSMGRSEVEVLNEILARQAIPELLEPADIAGTFLFLASPLARVITGQTIVVSNGEVMS